MYKMQKTFHRDQQSHVSHLRKQRESPHYQHVRRRPLSRHFGGLGGSYNQHTQLGNCFQQVQQLDQALAIIQTKKDQLQDQHKKAMLVKPIQASGTPGLLIVTKLMATNLLFGYSCCLIAGIGFAVNYLPVKGCDVGDGIFFSAAMSVGILLVGLVTGMFLTSTPNAEIPAFEPLAAAGGAIWMLGNLMCPYIIQTIGLGLGLTVWDLSNMLMGWVTGYLGLFGLPKEQDVKQPWANFVGLVLASVSLIFFSLASAFDDFEPAREVEIKKVNSECGDLPDIEDGQTTMQKPATLKHGERGDAGSDCANRMKAMLGFSMAILAGVLFGSTFDLPMDLKNGIFGPDHSQHIMDYVLSHFIGIFAAASFALTVYVKVRGKKSQLPRQLIVPSLVSGVIWGIAQVAWFQANIEVGFAIAFPIIGSLTGTIGLFIGCCCLGEVRTTRSRIFSLVGLLLRVPGVLLIALSSV